MYFLICPSTQSVLLVYACPAHLIFSV
jgi:hypothetical protein